MRQLILLLFISTVLLASLPAAEAGTQIKTVGFFIDQRLQNTQSDVASNAFWDSQTVPVTLPENSITIRSAWVEFRAVTTSAVAAQVVNVTLLVNGTQRSVANNTKPKYYLGSSAEEYPFYVYADVTPFLTGFSWSGTHGVNVSVRVNGVATNQHNALLWVTYEYDDTSPSQINTVIYPIYSWNSTIPPAKSIDVNFNTTIPENESILSQWANIYGWVDCASTTDALLHVNISGNNADMAKPLYVECGTSASYDTQFLLNLSRTNFAVNKQQSVTINTTGQTFEPFGGEIFITYNYTLANQNTLTKTVAYPMPDDGHIPSTSVRNLTTTFFLPETSTNMQQVWAHVTLGWTATTAGNAIICGTIGSAAINCTKFQLNAPGETMSENYIIFNLTEAKASLTNGTKVKLNVTYSAATSDSASAILYATYTYPKSAFPYQKTVQYFGYNTPWEQDLNSTNVDVIVPESSYSLNVVTNRFNAFAYTIAMSNATVDFFNITTNVSDGISSFVKVIKGNSIIRRTVSMINNDTIGVITGNGTYTLKSQQTEPQPATLRTGAAWINKIFFTYMTFNDSVAPTVSSIQTNQSFDIKQNYWVNFSSLWSDNNMLSSYWFSLNQSTNKNVNSTTVSFPSKSATGQASNLTLITARPGQKISWQFYANDTASNNGSTGWQNFTIAPGLRLNSTFGNNITGLTRSAVAVGDIDNDGFMDFVIMGLNLSTVIPSPVTKVYTYGRLSDGTQNMIENSTWEKNITPLGGGALALADFNNDGRLDLIISGQNDTATTPNRRIFIYTNNGTNFVENSTWAANLTPIYNGSIVAGDINNDGWIDIVISGTAEYFFAAAPLTRHFSWTGIYINNKTYLNYSAAFSRDLIGLNDSSAVLADFDNNSMPDLLIAGRKALTNWTGVYTNNGTNLNYNATFGVNITNSSTSTLSVADINNDRLMDVIQLIAGLQPQTARVYINNKTALVENYTWQKNITPLIFGKAAFGDVNNDGWLDLITQGFTNTTAPAADVQVYLSNGTDFKNNAPYESELTSTNHGDVALVDFTNDSDLDLLATGQTTLSGGNNVTKIYKNDIHLNNTNTQPSPPTAFSAVSNSLNSINFTWGAGSDTETPIGGLYYNLRIGTCTGCQNITSGVFGSTGPSSGGLFGNMQKRQRITLLIPNSSTYYWSVQTIDTGLAKSTWSAEQTYSPVSGADITPPTWNTQAQSANSISQFDSIYLSVQAADETNLTWAYLVTNETGVWKNWTDKYGSPQKLGGNTTTQVVNFTWTNFSLEGGQNIGWYIMLNDSTNNTNVTFIQNFTLLKTVSISIANSPIFFSNLQPSQSNGTTSGVAGNPLPFVINNTGNFAINTTIFAGNLFTKEFALNPSSYYQFMSEVNETNSVRDITRELITLLQNMPGSGQPIMVANMTNFTDANDEVRVHINITVPSGEPIGGKLSTVTFTASAAY